METNFRRMQLIFKFTKIKPELFYSVSFTKSDITLQGCYISDIARMMNKLKFRSKIDINGHAEFTRGMINVILT